MAIEIVTLAIGAVIVAGRASERGVKHTALCIHGHIEAPIIDAGAILPSVLGPRGMTRLARPRHGMKIPNCGAGPRIVGSRVPRLARRRLLGNIRADKNQVLED